MALYSIPNVKAIGLVVSDNFFLNCYKTGTILTILLESHKSKSLVKIQKVQDF